MFPLNWKYSDSRYCQADGVRVAHVSFERAFVLSIKIHDKSISDQYAFHVLLSADNTDESEIKWNHGEELLAVNLPFPKPVVQLHFHEDHLNYLSLFEKAHKNHDPVDLSAVCYNMPLTEVATRDLLGISYTEMMHIFKNSSEIDMSNFLQAPEFYKKAYGSNVRPCVSIDQITSFKKSQPTGFSSLFRSLFSL